MWSAALFRFLCWFCLLNCIREKNKAAEKRRTPEVARGIMKSLHRAIAPLLAIVAAASSFVASSLCAQEGKGESQKTYEELVQSARQTEILGYVVAGLGMLIVVAAIP